jgi:hypothetical protein
MNTLHVITQIPVPGEAIAWRASLTTPKLAKERFLSMTMHRVGLTFMAEETCCRGETSVLTSLGLATIRFQVRVDKFAVSS